MNRNRFSICFLLGLGLTCLLSFWAFTSKEVLDISNLKAENISETCEAISFEDAVRLDATISATSNRCTEENLNKLEDEIHEMTKSNVSYFRFMGTFSLYGNGEPDGTLTTLVIIAADSEPYFYEVRNPLVEVGRTRVATQWTQLDSSATIDADKTSVRLSAMGYISTTDRKQVRQDSNTIYPVFTVPISLIESCDVDSMSVN